MFPDACGKNLSEYADFKGNRACIKARAESVLIFLTFGSTFESNPEARPSSFAYTFKRVGIISPNCTEP